MLVDAKLAYGAQILWDTTSEESTVLFYDKDQEIYRVTVSDDSYQLELDSDWLKGIDDQQEITVQVHIGTMKMRCTIYSTVMNTENGTLSPSTWLSFDPQIHYFSHDHLVYAVPAILIILVIGNT